MLLPDTEQKISEKMRIVHILCAAFLVPTAIITALPFAGVLQVPQQPETPPVIFALIAAAAATLTLSFVLPSIGSRKAPAAVLPEFDPAFQTFFVLTIASLALREAAAIFGLVSFMLSGNLSWPLVFGGAAVAAMLLGWPKSDALRARLNR